MKNLKMFDLIFQSAFELWPFEILLNFLIKRNFQNLQSSKAQYLSKYINSMCEILYKHGEDTLVLYSKKEFWKK